MKKKNRSLVGWLQMFGFIMAVVSVIAYAFYVYGTAGEAVITVQTLDHKVYQSGDTLEDKYLIFTKSRGVYENTDQWLRFKFNSSDIQNQLEEGKRFKVKFYGWRFPIFSMYKNIYSVERVE